MRFARSTLTDEPRRLSSLDGSAFGQLAQLCRIQLRELGEVEIRPAFSPAADALREGAVPLCCARALRSRPKPAGPSHLVTTAGTILKLFSIGRRVPEKGHDDQAIPPFVFHVRTPIAFSPISIDQRKLTGDVFFTPVAGTGSVFGDFALET
jgi:hypothetical protein